MSTSSGPVCDTRFTIKVKHVVAYDGNSTINTVTC